MLVHLRHSVTLIFLSRSLVKLWECCIDGEIYEVDVGLDLIIACNFFGSMISRNANDRQNGITDTFRARLLRADVGFEVELSL